MTLNVANEADPPTAVTEPRLWINKGWRARVVKNEDDDGWAVEMIKDGESEPALVGPWTMGRDKKNPKPLDAAAFNTLVKTAAEVRRRHEQQLYATHHKTLSVNGQSGRIKVTFDIVADEDDPHALLTAYDGNGEALARVRVDAGFRFSASTVNAWISDDYRQPGGSSTRDAW
ncbi:MAG: hypothetical protein V5B35_04390 [Candidatus Accumulibacter necessarius]|jgi:hypothetical protein|uniref:hypothetical protein n=1 Tax=Candidatus Accumulibacter necessarius TaxID=2954386 RepID=UPI002FC392A8